MLKLADRLLDRTPNPDRKEREKGRKEDEDFVRKCHIRAGNRLTAYLNREGFPEMLVLTLAKNLREGPDTNFAFENNLRLVLDTVYDYDVKHPREVQSWITSSVKRTAKSAASS